MGGTKIFVVQLRQVIKTLIIAVIAVIIIGMLLYIFIPKGDTANDMGASAGEVGNALYYPGTYYSEIVLHNDPVVVGVTVTEDEIVSIDMEEMNESQQAFYPLFQPTMDELSAEIIEMQTLNVPITTNTAQTEEILIKAIMASLEQAEEKAEVFNSDMN